METETMGTQTEERPRTSIGGVTFIPVPKFTDADAAFGANRDTYVSDYREVKPPQKYRDLMGTLFFSGGKIPQFAPDVDRKAACLALRAWICSFDPKHEQKEATVAYALWVWMTPADQRAA